MKNAQWFLLLLLMAFIGVPILSQIVALIIAFIGGGLELAGLSGTISDVVLLVSGGAMIFASGRLWAGDSKQSSRIVWRHCLLLLPALFILSAWIIALHRSGLSFRYLDFNLYALPAILPWFMIYFSSVISGWYWGMVVIPVGSQICFTLGYGWHHWIPFSRSTERWCRSLILTAIVSLLLYAVYQAYLYKEKHPSINRENSLVEEINTSDYSLNKESKLTALRGMPELQLTKNWPRLDGATAAYPLYASAFLGLSKFPAQIFYGDYLLHSRTSEAYDNIISGGVDIIFVAQPSDGQKKRAEEAKVKLTYTPFAREAFVFITHANNPVSSLTEAQIRNIYSGKITRWNNVGGEYKSIQAWQRPVDSGSQTTMLNKVMKETPMLPPIETEIATAMEGIIHEVAEYQNTRGAIGYTFRYYATKMNANKNIQLLAINGIAPTVENIRNGTYPYVADVYMVTREKPTAETQKLVEWFLSPQGQQLVQDVGYVPIHPLRAGN